MLTDEIAFVMDVDAHADAHSVELVEAKNQRTRGQLRIPASRRGYRQR